MEALIQTSPRAITRTTGRLVPCLSVLALLLSGCGTPSVQRVPEPIPVVDTRNADYGPYPSNHEALVRSWAAENLKDPESARFGKISQPRKEYMFHNSQPFFGYSVCASINAKNSYGGYTGSQVVWVLIRDNKIARAQNTTQAIAGVIPGTTISRGHFVNCADGDREGN